MAIEHKDTEHFLLKILNSVRKRDFPVNVPAVLNVPDPLYYVHNIFILPECVCCLESLLKLPFTKVRVLFDLQ